MDPVSVVAAAVAIGASDGVRETAKTAISDAYGALRDWLFNRYESVSNEIVGLEQEPHEELRRALLAKKLGEAGAKDDSQLTQLAQALLTLVEQQKPDAPATVGVLLRRASVGGDIEIIDVAVQGGSGVLAEDIDADGSLRIRGVSASSPAEPHLTAGEETVKSELASAQTFSSTQRNVNVGRDNITHVTIGEGAAAGNSGGRVRAVTVSAEKAPIGDNLWKIAVNNGTNGPITDLDVDVYLVDESGARFEGRCVPAKGHISLENLLRDVLSEGLSGALGAAGHHARLGLPPGVSLGGMPSQFGQLSSYGPMMANHALALPQVSSWLRQAQQQMIDRFPRVVPAGQTAEVLYVADGQVCADIQFADEVGNLWRRPFGEQPAPVLVD